MSTFSKHVDWFHWSYGVFELFSLSRGIVLHSQGNELQGKHHAHRDILHCVLRKHTTCSFLRMGPHFWTGLTLALFLALIIRRIWTFFFLVTLHSQRGIEQHVEYGTHRDRLGRGRHPPVLRALLCDAKVQRARRRRQQRWRFRQEKSPKEAGRCVVFPSC